MTDLTDYMTEDRKLWENHNSPGAAEGRAIVQKEDDILQKQVDDKARTAYDATDLGASGPPEGDYDYRADYEAGNTLVPDEDGGITLNNKQFKPAAASVAGTDLVTGKQYTDHWKDEHGDIAKGRKALSEGQFNTLTGATYDQTDGLFDVANGMIKEGATFKEYQDQVVGPWNNDQMGMAWHAAISAHQTMEDIDTQGRRYYDEMRENYDQFEGVVHSIPADGYTEESLSLDKDWIKGSRRMGEFLFGAGSNDDKTDEQIAEAAKMFISQTRNNIDMTVLWANRIINENDPELARTWLALDAQYDAMDITSESIGRFATAQMNVTNLLTFGGGILITQMGKFATGQGIKNAIKGVAYGTAYDATLSGAAGVAENLSRQNIEIVGEARTKVDPLEATFSGVLSAGAGVVIGGTVNVASNKTVRDYAVGKAGDAVNFMGQNMSDLGIGPMPGSPAAQRGSVGFDSLTPVTGDQQVTASFKLQGALTGLKDGSKPITVRENVRAMVNKGLITEQEVKWSGLEEFVSKKEAAGQKISRQELIDHVERTTPKPELITSQTPQYHDYSLMAKTTEGDDAGLSGVGYRENMLVLPGRADPDSNFSVGHLNMAQKTQLDADDAMIGHSRVESASTEELGVGKMVLEIQSDFHKEGQQGGYVDSGGDWIGNQVALAGHKGPGAIEHSRLISDYASRDVREASINNIIRTAEEHGIDPYAKNAVAKLWPHLTETERALAGESRPIYQPYGKDWDNMGMRLEIMDSINNGDDFIAWPASGDQISAIEQWGGVYGNEGIIKRATVDRNKAMKKMGLEVEEVDMPQYKDSGMADYPWGEDAGEAAGVYSNYLRNEQRQLAWYDSDSDTWTIKAYPNEEDWIKAQAVYDNTLTSDGRILPGWIEGSVEGTQQYDDLLKHLDTVGDDLGTFDVDAFLDMAHGVLSDDPAELSTKFNVIRLTDDVKAKFRKEGMNMYGAAPVGLGASGIPLQSAMNPEPEEVEEKPKSFMDDPEMKKIIRKAMADPKNDEFFEALKEWGKQRDEEEAAEAAEARKNDPQRRHVGDPDWVDKDRARDPEKTRRLDAGPDNTLLDPPERKEKERIVEYLMDTWQTGANRTLERGSKEDVHLRALFNQLNMRELAEWEEKYREGDRKRAKRKRDAQGRFIK